MEAVGAEYTCFISSCF